LRTANVERSFGNKTTWNTDFPTLFTRFSSESSEKVFSNSKINRATCKDIFEIENEGFDLVYLDPPYTRVDEHHPQDYHALYHFLEGICDYKHWPDKIDMSKVNKCMLKRETRWEKNSLEENFKYLFKKFQDSIIVVSYGHPGNPHISKIKKLLKRYKSKVLVVKKEYAYRLNHNNGNGLYEVLMIGK
jgi:adenine-specific DNA-methyltransferase